MDEGGGTFTRLVVMLSMLVQVNAVCNGVASVWIKLWKEGLMVGKAPSGNPSRQEGCPVSQWTSKVIAVGGAPCQCCNWWIKL